MSAEQLLPKYSEKNSDVDTVEAPTDNASPKKKCKRIVLRKIILFAGLTWLFVHLAKLGRGGHKASRSWQDVVDASPLDIDELHFDREYGTGLDPGSFRQDDKVRLVSMCEYKC